MKIVIVGETPQDVGLLVASAGQAAEGIELVRAARPDEHVDADAVILTMPESGFASLPPRVSDIPTVALVSSADVGEEAVAAGADDYLIRDQSPPAAVLRAVRRAIRMKERAASPAVQERDAAVAELGRFLLASRDIATFVDEACRLLVRALAASHAAFIEVDPRRPMATIRAAAGRGIVLDPVLDATSDAELAFVTRANRPVIVPDYAFERRFAHASFIAANGIDTAVCCPVIGRGVTIGVLGVWAAGRESFTEGDAAFVEAVANLIGDFVLREHEQRRRERQESLLRMASSLGRIGAWVVDLADGEITWSDELRSIHDVPQDFVATIENGLDLYAEEFREPLASAVQECARTGKPFDLEVQVGSGKGRWLRIIGEAEYESGRIRSVRGASQDITVFKAAENEARRQGERLTTMLESITDGFVLIGPDRTVTYMNSAAEQVFGVRREAVLGREIGHVLAAFCDRRCIDEAEKILASSEPARTEAHCSAIGRWLSIRAFPSPEGKAIYLRDISEERRARQALLDSERRFRTLAEALPQIVWMTTPDGTHVYANPRWREYVGDTASDRHWSEAVHPDDRQRALEEWKDARTREQIYETELRLRRHDGFHRWMLVRALPVRDEDGRVTHWLGTSTDVHDLHEALEATRASARERAALVAALEHEKRTLVDIFRQAPNFMAVLRGPNHVFEYANDAYYRCIGRRDVIGKTVAEALPELVGQQYPALLDHVFATGQPVVLHSTPIMLRRKADCKPEQRYVDFVYHPLTDSAGTVTGIVAQGADVTERHSAEAQVRQQAAPIDEASDAIIVRDLDLRITFWSKGAERLYGFSAADAIGKHSENLFGMEKGAYSATVETVLATGKAHLELRITNARGHAMTIDRRCTLLCDQDGRPAEILTFDTDITDRKRVEEHLLREQRVESIGRLASGVAHDLNNLLTPVLMGASLLRPLVDGERALHAIRLIERSARRGADLVERILSFARGADGARIPVHVGHVIEEVVGIMRSTFARNIAIDVRVAEDLGWIDGDPTQLHQLLLNLCLNARDVMPHGGRLTISATNETIDEHQAVLHGGLCSGRYVRLRVADTGRGIAPDIVEKIFDPFFTTKEIGEGSGLGLTTAAAIVRRHSGTITVETAPQRGTVFEIHLPAQREADQPQESGRPPAARGAGELLLVVDDEAAVVTVVRSALESGGYRVLSARNGADAVAVFASRKSDIAAVITDVRMPVMDGAALVAALRRMDAKIPIIASTGGDLQGETREIAADVILRKPYPSDVLLDAVRQVLARSSAEPDRSRA